MEQYTSSASDSGNATNSALKPSVTKVDRNVDNENVTMSRGSLEFAIKQYPCAKMKLDQFFLEWLSTPGYSRLIATVLSNASQKIPLNEVFLISYNFIFKNQFKSI